MALHDDISAFLPAFRSFQGVERLTSCACSPSGQSDGHLSVWHDAVSRKARRPNAPMSSPAASHRADLSPGQVAASPTSRRGRQSPGTLLSELALVTLVERKFTAVRRLKTAKSSASPAPSSSGLIEEYPEVATMVEDRIVATTSTALGRQSSSKLRTVFRLILKDSKRCRYRHMVGRPDPSRARRASTSIARADAARDPPRTRYGRDGGRLIGSIPVLGAIAPPGIELFGCAAHAGASGPASCHQPHHLADRPAVSTGV